MFLFVNIWLEVTKIQLYAQLQSYKESSIERFLRLEQVFKYKSVAFKWLLLC